MLCALKSLLTVEERHLERSIVVDPVCVFLRRCNVQIKGRERVKAHGVYFGTTVDDIQGPNSE